MSYESVLKQVIEAIAKRDIAQAESVIKAHPMTEKHPLLYRAHYAVMSHPGSTMHDPEKALKLLKEMTGTFTDAWPCVELARVLIHHRKSSDDIDQAEDLLNKHREKDLSAKYWLAEIYSRGLNSDQKGSPVFDLKEAMILYHEIYTHAQGLLRNTAIERYCEVAISMGNLGAAKETEVFGLLNTLNEEKPGSADALLGKLMIKKIKDITLSPHFQNRFKNDSIVLQKSREHSIDVILEMFGTLQ